MKITGTTKYAHKYPNLPSKKQLYIIKSIEIAYEGKVKFTGTDAREAYNFIGKYHSNVKTEGTFVYKIENGMKIYKGRIFKFDK